MLHIGHAGEHYLLTAAFCLSVAVMLGCFGRRHRKVMLERSVAAHPAGSAALSAADQAILAAAAERLAADRDWERIRELAADPFGDSGE